MHYVAGLMFSPDYEWFAAIRKAKPVWQAGKLNGVGGKVEMYESAAAAMIREFREETGCATEPADWRPFLQLKGTNDDGEAFQVDFFAAIGDLERLASAEEEQVELVNVRYIHALRPDVIENLPWIVALAVDNLRDGRPRTVIATYGWEVAR